MKPAKLFSMVGVNYKDGGPALTDLIGGQISAFFSGVASGSAQIRAGKIRALGVTTARDHRAAERQTDFGNNIAV